MLEVLSRAANSDHGTARQASVVQMWRRMFQLKKAEPELSDDQLAKRASVGVARDIAKAAVFMPKFVAKWSGGRDASVLKHIEAYEQSLKVKRKLRPQDLKVMGDMNVLDYMQWVPAVIKAMLCAPKSYVDTGLLTASELNQLKSTSSKLYPTIKEACVTLESALWYMDAHIVPQKMTQAKGMQLMFELDLCFGVGML